MWTVGPGGSPDENGETTLDALVMNGVIIHPFACPCFQFRLKITFLSHVWKMMAECLFARDVGRQQWRSERLLL